MDYSHALFFFFKNTPVWIMFSEINFWCFPDFKIHNAFSRIFLFLGFQIRKINANKYKKTEIKRTQKIELIFNNI